jgi:hypothetical protein
MEKNILKLLKECNSKEDTQNKYSNDASYSRKDYPLK